MNFIIQGTLQAIKELYNTDLSETAISLQETRKEFEGQVTVVTFPLTRVSKKTPEQTGDEIGAYLKDNIAEVTAYNVIKGFLNISISDSYWLQLFSESILASSFGILAKNGQKVMVEYSSPNTNKPLHLGHVRNNLLGYSVSQILDAGGFEVLKANLVNDRGIHICKSMLAWQLFGNNETPVSTGLKGDHLVGKYYVIFDKEYKKEIEELKLLGSTEDEAKKNAPLIRKAQEKLFLCGKR
jgi:arginyl-tRNA synthetase